MDFINHVHYPTYWGIPHEIPYASYVPPVPTTHCFANNLMHYDNNPPPQFYFGTHAQNASTIQSATTLNAHFDSSQQQSLQSSMSFDPNSFHCTPYVTNSGDSQQVGVVCDNGHHHVVLLYAGVSGGGTANPTTNTATSAGLQIGVRFG
jgi:hypothetical protein